MEKYIEEIIVHNFESIEHQSMKLDPSFNIVIGESDTGKTAFCIRALRWLFYNDYTGDFFVRNKKDGSLDKNGKPLKEDNCYVTVIYNTGEEVTRQRKKNSNYYIVTDENGECFQYENFGNNIPDKVIEVTGVKKLVVEKDLQLPLNIPRKKEFNVIYMNNGIKSKVISALAGTNILDAVVREMKVDFKKHCDNISTFEKDLKDIDKKLENYENFDKEESLIKKGNTLIEKINTIKKQLNELSSLKNELNTYQKINKELEEEISTKDYYVSKLKYLESLELKCRNISLESQTKNMILNLANSLNEYYKLNISLEKIIESKPSILKKLEILNEKEQKIIDITNKYIDKQKKINMLKDLQSTLVNLKDDLEKSNIFIKEKSIFEQKLLELNKKEINIENIKKIIDEKINKINLLSKYNTDLIDLNSSMNSLNKVIIQKDTLKIKEKNILAKEKEINKISQTFNEKSLILKKITSLKSELDVYLKKEKEGSIILESWKNSVYEQIDIYIENIKKLGKCPLCKSDITLEHLQDLRNEFNI